MIHTIVKFEVRIYSGSWDIALTIKREGRAGGRTDGQPENIKEKRKT